MKRFLTASLSVKLTDRTRHGQSLIRSNPTGLIR
uniref:Uncharacterized protein n=1 Tax=Arundo donax TaxID=35708 RepID=A0A0A9B1G1_ARUDO